MHRGSPEVEKIFRKNKAGTTIISKYDYLVNAIGQRTNVTTSGSAFPATPSWAWGYDSLGQVTTADSSVSTSDRAYQYDAIGNRKKSADSLTLPGSDNYTSNALNQYSAIGNPQSTIVNPIHDDDGNLRFDGGANKDNEPREFVWDAESRLITVKRVADGTTLVSYTYDAQSRRISRSVGVSPTASSTIYIYDAWNPIAEYSGTSLTRTYLWGTDLSGSLQGAGGVGGLLCESQISNSQISNFYPTYDANGNVSEYLAADGSTAAHFEYDPFGNTIVNTDTSNLFAYRFSTKPLDQVTGLYYYGYRHYDPVTGRWPSRDPIEEQGGLNLYGFVENNSANDFDYLGLMGDMGDCCRAQKRACFEDCSQSGSSLSCFEECERASRGCILDNGVGHPPCEPATSVTVKVVCKGAWKFGVEIVGPEVTIFDSEGKNLGTITIGPGGTNIDIGCCTIQIRVKDIVGTPK